MLASVAEISAWTRHIIVSLRMNRSLMTSPPGPLYRSVATEFPFLSRPSSLQDWTTTVYSPGAANGFTSAAERSTLNVMLVGMCRCCCYSD